MSTVEVLPDGAVENEARDVFGLGLNRNTGVPGFDGSVPTTGGASKAMTYIGQGKVLVSPLDTASVAATAKAGEFRRPVLVPASVDNRQIARAPRQLSASADAALRDLMKLTAREGTAAPTIGGLSGDVGAKTGTAEVDGRKSPTGGSSPTVTTWQRRPWCPTAVRATSSRAGSSRLSSPRADAATSQRATLDDQQQ